MPLPATDPAPELSQEFKDSIKTEAEKFLGPSEQTLREVVKSKNFPFALTAIGSFFEDVLTEDYGINNVTAVPVEFTLRDTDPDSHTILIGFQIPPANNSSDKKPPEIANSKETESFAAFANDLHAVIADLMAEEVGEKEIAHPTATIYADKTAKTLAENYANATRKEKSRLILGGIGVDPLTYDEVSIYADTVNMGGLKLTVTHIEDFVAILRKMHERNMFWSHPEPISHIIDAPLRESTRAMVLAKMQQDETALYDMHTNTAYASKDAMLVDFTRSMVQINRDQHLGHRYSLHDLDQFVALYQVNYRRTLELDKPVMWLQ